MTTRDVEGGGSEQARLASAATDDGYAARRAAMVEDQLVARDVTDARVLAAMRTVPRHRFVPPELARLAYEDRPLPLGTQQTISQPYVVAAMTQLAEVGPGARVLDVGTGSGYQAAVLAEVGAEVYSIEIDAERARVAAETLRLVGYGDIRLRVGDGHVGWPEAAPFDAILCAAAPREVPAALRHQLRVGGRLVIPVGGHDQELMVITRTGLERYDQARAFPVAFVPMVRSPV